MTINERDNIETSHTRYYISKDSKLAKDIDRAKMLASSAIDRILFRGEDMSELKGCSQTI